MKGFLISFLFNLIFHRKLLILAVFAWVAGACFDFPGFVVYVLLGLWIIISLLITLGLGVLSRGTPPPPHQKNVNPYSKTTKDYTKNYKNNN